MLDKDHQFKRSLLRMMQAGMLEEMLECQAGQPAAVEFRLERVYQVHLKRGKIVLKERDSETVRRRLNGRWQRLGQPMIQLDQIVIKRPDGNVGHHSSAGALKGTSRPAILRQRKPAALVGAV
ncbi:MAG: hypothetical protein Q8R91_05920 [Candidatus Omnitrophota bacterium]|nr:hypothetical protein [Candidatus Omnitrophota bacterium]